MSDGLKACNNCGCDQIQFREEGAYLPFYRYCRNCLAQGPASATYEGAEVLWNKLNTQLEDWIDADDLLPDHGQTVVGMANNGGAWVEVWDEEEPIGCMRCWYPLPKSPV